MLLVQYYDPCVGGNFKTVRPVGLTFVARWNAFSLVQVKKMRNIDQRILVEFAAIRWEWCDARILVRSSLLLRLIMMMIGRRRSELLMRFQRLCTLQTLVANLSSTFEWGQKKSWMWQKIGTKLNSSIEDSRRRSIANFAIRIWLL